MTGVNKPLYYMFLLRSYRCFARVPQESRKVPAREAASDPNERLVTEYSAPVTYIYVALTANFQPKNLQIWSLSQRDS